MKVLLLHPEDSPRRGPWTSHQWDLVVDLGKSSETAAASWQEQLGCPVLRLESFRRGTDDLREVRGLLLAGRGRLLDQEGLDWWDLTAILIQAEMETSLLLLRAARELARADEFYASQPGWPGDAMAAILGRGLSIFSDRATTRYGKRFRHYRHVLGNLPIAQLGEIFFDKLDACYRWRARFAARRSPSGTPVVLLPSAYTNVSRTAAAYARMLPEQQFLLVATRRSGTLFDIPSNVAVASLASYAGGAEARPEYAGLLRQWKLLQADLRKIPEIGLLARFGRLDRFPHLVRQGLAVRDAWRQVFEREPVQAVLCGDDTNPCTRLPVLLARRRGLPTLDFHHGALDGRFLIKDLPSDFYLAKSEMERDYLVRVCGFSPERVVMGAPGSTSNGAARLGGREPSSIVFFSEPYESSGARGEEVYREIVSPLARLAHNSGKKLIVKLHPFESARARAQLVRRILPPNDADQVEMIEGPLRRDLLAKTWFGVTVESTAVMDCILHGVPCFVCAWLGITPYGYVQQYARFGVGHALQSAAQFGDLPRMLDEHGIAPQPSDGLRQSIEPDKLRQLLAGACGVNAGQKESKHCA